MGDGFEGYDSWKLQSPEDAYWSGRRPLCTRCVEAPACEGRTLCEDCANEREREEER